jgi:hypothetical protein
LIAKLLWDPDADFEKLLNEFLSGYYGPAAPFVREYIDLIHDSAEKTKEEMTCYTKADAAFLTPEVLSRASAVFDRAEEVVQGDAVFLKRVQTARLPYLCDPGTRASRLPPGGKNTDSSIFQPGSPPG